MGRGGGPKPLSIATLEARGSPRAKIRRAIEAAASSGVPAAFPAKPGSLSAEAGAKWDELRPILERSGAYSAITGDRLAAYCECWVIWHAAMSATKAGKNLKAVALYMRMDALLEAKAKALGLDKVGVPGTAPQNDDPNDLGSFLKGRHE